MRTVLTDRETGATVQVQTANLSQKCACCDGPLGVGEVIVSVSRGKIVGWCHLKHLERLLLEAAADPVEQARRRLRELLISARPGDTVTLTAEVLSALGIEVGDG